MKRILLGLVMLATMSINAQYDRLAFSGEIGFNAIGDQSAKLDNSQNAVGLTVRYSMNPITSIGISTGWSNLSLINKQDELIDVNYGRISTELFADLFDILQLQNNFITILGHGGPGFSRISTTGYQENIFSTTAGVTGLIKLSNKLAFNMTYRNTANITQSKSLDGSTVIANSGVNSTVGTFTGGLTLYFGKKGKQHADWYKK